ncbi:MAG: AbrB/MazE/SpoVT family DNA-binding domain-containing protein [bacterium]
MSTVNVSAKGQLVVPGQLRKKYNIKPMSKIELMDTGYGVMLIPIPEDPVKASRGMLKGGKASTKTLLTLRRKDKEIEEIKFGRLKNG